MFFQEEHDSVIADVPQVVCNAVGDDDLTSLTWLQDKNLLKKGTYVTMSEKLVENWKVPPPTTVFATICCGHSPNATEDVLNFEFSAQEYRSYRNTNLQMVMPVILP